VPSGAHLGHQASAAAALPGAQLVRWEPTGLQVFGVLAGISCRLRTHFMLCAPHSSIRLGRVGRGFLPQRAGGARVLSVLCAPAPGPRGPQPIFLHLTPASACCAACSSPGSGVAHTGRCTAQAAPCSTAAAQLGHAHACCPAHGRAQLGHARACCQSRRPGCWPGDLPWEHASRRGHAAARSAELSRHAAAHCWPLRPCCLVCLSLELLVFSRMHALAR